MIATPDQAVLRRLDDDELRAHHERLERTVHELREARGEIGLRIKLLHVEQLTAARAEVERRRC